MEKKLNLKQWISDRITILQKESKICKIKDRFWVIFLLFVNLTTIVAAILALTFLFLRTPAEHLNFSGNLSLIFTIVSLVFIISTFFLQIINKIYITRMRDKIYRVSIDKLKVEMIKFNNKIGNYAKGNAELQLEAVINQVNADILTFKNIKIKMRQAFVSTATGGK